MNKHITIIDLNDKANFFAYKIGILAIEPARYVCEALDQEDEKLHTQTFILQKTIEGLPPNNASLVADVMKAWNKYLQNLERANQRESL